MGSPEIKEINAPRWDGKQPINNKIVLLYCEGGFGDQIMFYRCVKWLKEKGAKVVVACHPDIMKLFSRSECVGAVIPREFATKIYVDYFIPSMSSFLNFDVNWGNIWYGPYIKFEDDPIWDNIIPTTKKKNIGLRWRGNPLFEHEQYRAFPPELMTQLSDNRNYEFFSFQKDDSRTILPNIITDLDNYLSTWENTANAIKRMDLIISSCTSVAHLAAAMKKEIWVIVPVMPYFPWAEPGNQSSWYSSVKIFRQKEFGKWDNVFEDIKTELIKLEK